LIIPVFFYYFLIDIDQMKSRAFHLIPKPFQSFAEVRLRKFDNVLSGFLRGQLTVACTLSVLYAIGLSLVGIKYGVLIGIFAGWLNIVPYLGVGLGLISSILMSFFSGSLLWSLCGVGIVFGVVNTFEGFYLTPKIVGDKVGLTPITTIIIILIGGELFGVAGMLVAVPLGGIGRVLVRDLKAAYLKSNLYRRD